MIALLLAATVLAQGSSASGDWTLTAEKRSASGVKGVCLELASAGGSGTGCAFGSIRAGGNIFPTSAMTKAGDTVTASLVAGLVVRRARTVRVHFADGKRMRLRTRVPPRRFRRVLKARVRSFAGDGLETSPARIVRVVGLDRRGRRVARSHVGN